MQNLKLIGLNVRHVHPENFNLFNKFGVGLPKWAQQRLGTFRVLQRFEDKSLKKYKNVS